MWYRDSWLCELSESLVFTGEKWAKKCWIISGGTPVTCWTWLVSLLRSRREVGTVTYGYVTHIPEVFSRELCDRLISLQLINMSMLPPTAVFRLPWEVDSMTEGESVRTFGRSGFKYRFWPISSDPVEPQDGWLKSVRVYLGWLQGKCPTLYLDVLYCMYL